MKTPAPAKSDSDDTLRPAVHSHLRWGWWSLLAFLMLGIVLEAFHGFKIGWYLNVSTQTRRLLFTLSHAHGALFGLVHIAFALTLPHLPTWEGGSRKTASACLKVATLLLPGGFLLGGIVLHHGDPGLGILLVPLGALLLLVSAGLCAVALKPENTSAPR